MQENKQLKEERERATHLWGLLRPTRKRERRERESVERERIGRERGLFWRGGRMKKKRKKERAAVAGFY